MKLVLAVAAGVLVCAAGAASSPLAPAVTGGQIIQRLNGLRQANGIPGGIVENREWSRRCALHTRYMQLNKLVTHDELKARPGYTADGAWAGKNSVLGPATTWPARTPFELAPIHLAQLLGPALSEAGAAVRNGYVCVTTWPGYKRTFAGDRVHTYPGDGSRGRPPSEIAYDFPFVPGDFVGVRKGARTGPHLYVWAELAASTHATVRIKKATLNGPAGSVPLRWVDSTTRSIGVYLPATGVIVPLRVLAPLTTYSATVDLVADGIELSHSWRFTTALAPNAVTVGLQPAGGRRVRFLVRSDAPSPALRVTGATSARPPLARVSAGVYRSAIVSLRSGRSTVCASSGGGKTGFTAARSCIPVTFS